MMVTKRDTKLFENDASLFLYCSFIVHELNFQCFAFKPFDNELKNTRIIYTYLLWLRNCCDWVIMTNKVFNWADWWLEQKNRAAVNIVVARDTFINKILCKMDIKVEPASQRLARSTRQTLNRLPSSVIFSTSFVHCHLLIVPTFVACSSCLFLLYSIFIVTYSFYCIWKEDG